MRTPPPPRISRSDEGSLFRRGAIGIGLVALISLGATVMGMLLAVLVSLGY